MQRLRLVWLMVVAFLIGIAAAAAAEPRSDQQKPTAEFRLRWRLPVCPDRSDEDIAKQIAAELRAKNKPAWAAAQPLVADDYVFMRTPARTIAIEKRTGKRVWEYPWLDRLNATKRDRRKVRWDSEIFVRHQIWDNAVFARTGTVGGALFMLNRNSRWLDYRHPNELAALEIRKQGKLLWLTGGEDGRDDERLKGYSFLGPPVGLDNRLFAIAEAGDHLKLVELDPQTGKRVWEIDLADSRPIGLELVQPVVGAIPAMAGELVICSTEVGKVVAVDVAMRKIAWEYKFEAVIRLFRERPVNGILVRLGDRWADSETIVAGERLLLTTLTSDKLHCLDVKNGNELWTINRGKWLKASLADNDLCLLIGAAKIAALQVKDGKPAWDGREISLGNSAMTSGRGCLVGGHYLLPTTAQELLAIDWRKGKIVRRIGSEIPLGNLVFPGGELFSQDHRSIASFDLEQFPR